MLYPNGSMPRKEASETIGKSQAEFRAAAPVFPDQCQSSLYDTSWSEFMTESSRHRGEIDRPRDFRVVVRCPCLKQVPL